MFCDESTYSMDSYGWCVGISFAYKAGYCFVFNLYLPCLSAFDNDSELKVLECMSFIYKTINDFIDCNGACEISIIIADYNAKFQDICSNYRLIAVKTLLNDFDLICCYDKDVSGKGCTYYHDGLGHKSYIDHMFLTKKNKEQIVKYEPIEGGDNLSYHLSVRMELEMDLR